MKRYVLFCLFILCGFSLQSQTKKTITAASIAMHGKPKYADGFTHFDYVNPDAPKGGSLTREATGTYDNFHRYALRGHSSVGVEFLYDTLLARSQDEIESYYPLIAEKFEYAEDYSFIIFYINPRARDQDGAPITAEDVAFSFNLFYEKGVPQFRSYYAGVVVTVLDPLRVRFDIPVLEGERGDKEKMLGFASSPIFPKRFWESGRDFSEPLTEPPLGTGVYRIGDYKMGQYVTLERVKDYWATDLPVNKGQYNFDTIRYDYYRDESVSFEAFKAGAYDYREETSAVNWATQYNGKHFDSGKIKKEEVSHEIARPMQAFVFNIQRPLFQDPRVRKALNYFLDFEWMNKHLFYNQYKRTRSYFQSTVYAADGLPSPEELAILEPIKRSIPPEVFAKTYNPPVMDGTGFIRNQAREALKLLNEAGWELKAGKLVSKTTGEQMRFELIIYDTSSERIAVPFQRNLRYYGIEMSIRSLDTSQFINRLRERDFDMTHGSSSAYSYPSSDLAIEWHSNYIDSTWNTPGVSDPSVDYLIESIMANQEDDQKLLYIGRALDRVLTWNFYGIPLWHSSLFRLAYIDKFGKPAIRPKYSVGLYTWWVK
jgi:microcin C transport system substrate-binding protein